jgi:hypothetical protein
MLRYLPTICAMRTKQLLLVAMVLPFIFVSMQNIAAQSWTQLTPSGGPPNARAGASAIFDTATSQMIVYGGGRCTDFGDTWSLTLSGTLQWTQLNPSGSLPSARVGHTAVYDSANSRMTVFGGGLGCTAPCSNDTWVLSNTNSVTGSPAWTQLSPTGGPPVPRIFHTAVYDPGSNRMIVFGGNNCYSAGAEFYNDVWILTNADGLGGAPVWTQLTTAGTPPGRENHTAVYDSASNTMTVFGGYNAGGFLNDVWNLSNANGSGGTPAWSKLTPSGTSPSVRAGSAAVYDPTSNRMIVFGGSDSTSKNFSEIWILSGVNGAGSSSWALLSPSGAPPAGREELAAIYNPLSNEVVIYAGAANGAPAPYSDTWALQLSTNATIPGLPFSDAVGATWIDVFSPFSGDANGDSYTTYEYANSSTGPWTAGCNYGIPGDPDWRHCSFQGLTSATPYYVRVTFYDPDGVTGTNPQIIGPITTASTSNNFVTLGQATAKVEDTNILVTVPIADDANTNSGGTVSVATSPSGPWTQRCSSLASIGPKLCRIHGLTTGTDYYLQVSVNDPDGVQGTNPQVIGPVHYTGLTDLSLGKPVTADPGWGCCSDPNQLTNGVINASNWMNGFAWTGGTGDWGGGGPGIKQATIDLQTAQTVGRVDWWVHATDSGSPTTWNIAVSNDGSSFTQVFANTEVRCRTATQALQSAWWFPSCKLSGSFAPVTARYVRFSFDDTTLLGGFHGWATQIEVFNSPGTTAIPTTTTLTADINPQIGGGSATFTASVAPSSGTGTPTGTVTFLDGSTQLTQVAIDGAGHASYASSSLTIGMHTITASYSGDANYAASSTTLIEQIAVPMATVSPAALTFGPEAVGTPSLPQTVTVINSGVVDLHVSGVLAGAPFAATNGCPIVLPSGQSCSITVVFTPALAGKAVGSLQIADDAAISPQTVALSGSTGTLVVSVAPPSLAFGNQALNQASAATTINLKNSGTARLAIASIVPSVSDYVVSGGTCGISVAPGTSCTILVTFTPSVLGQRTAQLLINDNAATSPQKLTLTGAGAAATPTSATYLTFVNTAIGTSSTKTVTLTNNEATPLESLTITPPPDFNAVGCGTTLAAHTSCIITVTFTPTRTGTRNGQLSISATGMATTQTVQLNAKAVVPISLTPRILVFPTPTPVGVAATAMTITIQNLSSAALVIGTIAASGDFAATSNCPASLSAGKTCIVTVTFTPSVDTWRSGVLSISDGASGSPHTALLAGTGYYQ